MELIKISDSKLKIALTPTDMEKYSLDIQTMDYDKTETRSAFWQLLDEAKHKTGFDAASEKIFVQIYSSIGGGCEMYVTKLKKTVPYGSSGTDERNGQDMQDRCGTEDEQNGTSGQNLQDKQDSQCNENGLPEQGSDNKQKASNAVLPEYVKSAVTEAIPAVKCICRVSALDELLQLCLYVENHLDVSQSSAYLEKTSDGKCYYLVFSYRPADGCKESEIPENLYLSEFGSLMKEKTGVYISEHCQCICERDAVKILSALL